ncbi:MAG TPA: dihydrodipicolinate synthase family protein [Acetobacteraceae bacterium]|jgi:4-hydroxy-tetrahydrodipicolinate synthase
MSPWSGVFPAVTTKLRQDGAIDLPATQASIDRLIANGVAGVIVLPMLGENACMSTAEQESVVRAAREVVAGRVVLLSGLAEISSADAAAAARRYAACGAEGLMAFPSLGYKTDPRETVAWYKGLAAASDLPIMIYNNPIAYGVDVTPAILGELADTKQIVAIKEETGDIRRVTDIVNAMGERYGVFCGVDDLLLESMALGAVGWVSGMTNAWPAECVEIFTLCAAGRFADARGLYRLMTPAFHLDTDVKLVQYIKLAEHLVYGAPEWCRAPRLPLEGAERTRVVGVIESTIAALERRRRQAA